MTEVALMLLLLLLAYGMGAWILRLFKISYSSLEEFVFATGLGFGVVAYLMFLIGMLGLLYTRVAYGLLGILLISAFPSIKRILLKLYRSRPDISNFRLSRLGIIVGLILLAHIAVNLIADMAPPMNGDTLATYLAIPKIWVEKHKIVEISYHPASYIPSTIQMLSTLGLLLRNGILSQLISGFLMGVLAIVVIYLLARQKYSQEVSLAAAAIFYATNVVCWLAYSAKVDLGWAFFELLAIYGFFRFLFAQDKEANQWLLLAGVFLGFSVGIKYSAYSAPIIVLGAIIKFVFLDKKPLKIAAKPLGYFLIITALVASPWYIRNQIFTGNPVCPVLTDLYVFAKSFNQTSGIIGYFTVFWHMSMVRMAEGNSMPAGPIFLAFIPGLLFLRKVDYRIKFMLLYSLAFSILWYSQLQRTRHFLPVLALLSIVAAYGIYRLMDGSALLRKLIPIILVAMLSFNLAVTVKRNIYNHNPILYIIGREGEEEFLSRALTRFISHANYGMIKYINEETENSAKILAFPHYVHSYYFDRDIYDDDKIANAQTVEEVLREVEREGFTHVFVNAYERRSQVKPWQRHLFRLPLSFSSSGPLDELTKIFGKKGIFLDTFKDRYLELIFSHGGQYLYRIRDYEKAQGN